MTESVTFQAILERGRESGRLQEAISLVMKLGRKRFGPADSSTTAVIEQIADLSRIEQLHERLLEVNSWNELLALPGDGQD